MDVAKILSDVEQAHALRRKLLAVLLPRQRKTRECGLYDQEAAATHDQALHSSKRGVLSNRTRAFD